MSDNREFNGLALVREADPRGMIALRGDLSSAKFKKAAAAAAGVKMVDRGTCTTDGAGGMAWMSLDEVLVMCAADSVAGTIAGLDKALSGTHYLASDVSDARAVFEISGDAARDVLAKLCPVDLRPGSFAPGQFRRTRIAQVACAFWLDEGQTFHLICFRSVADYVWALLVDAAQEDAPVGYFAG